MSIIAGGQWWSECSAVINSTTTCYDESEQGAAVADVTEAEPLIIEVVSGARWAGAAARSRTFR
jgi:hypothetical protein